LPGWVGAPIVAPMSDTPDHRSLSRLAGLVLAGMVAACSSSPPSPRDAAPPPPAESQRPATVTVVSGDTVYSIARRYNLSVRDLIEVNRLDPPYLLIGGQVLRLPGSSDYVVQRGDTLIGLARRFKVDFNSLAATNHKTPPYVLRVGEKLTLPSGTPPGDATAGRPPVVIASPNAPSTAPTPPVAGPAAPPPRFAAEELPPPAPPSSAPPLTAAPARDAAASPAAAPSPAAPPPSPPSAGPAPSNPPPPVPTPSAPPPPAAAPAAAAATDETPPNRAGSGFLWPIKGEVVAEFGPLPGKGQHNDGINIAAARGTPVRATENGVVVYVGNELKGFGNLLLIKHADGWMSAYAHAEQLKVERGARVRRGQVIATVGSSGNASQPQLHFEIRRGTEAVNPLDHLPKQRGGR